MFCFSVSIPVDCNAFINNSYTLASHIFNITMPLLTKKVLRYITVVRWYRIYNLILISPWEEHSSLSVRYPTWYCFLSTWQDMLNERLHATLFCKLKLKLTSMSTLCSRKAVMWKFGAFLKKITKLINTFFREIIPHAT